MYITINAELSQETGGWKLKGRWGTRKNRKVTGEESKKAGSSGVPEPPPPPSPSMQKQSRLITCTQWILQCGQWILSFVCPIGKWSFFWKIFQEFQITEVLYTRRNHCISSILNSSIILVRNCWGLVRMIFGLVHHSYSLPMGQAWKLVFCTLLPAFTPLDQ